MLSFNFTPFPNLETNRLILRRVAADDADAIIALRGNAENMKYVPRPLVTTREMAIEHLAMIDDKIEKNEGINWAITLKENPAMIGIIGHYRLQPENYRAEIGYMLLPEFQGKGIVSEAIKKVVDYGFNSMNLHSIEAVIDPDNIASAIVLEKNNFVKEAHLVDNVYYNGRFYDSVIYSLLKRNFIQ